MIYFFTPYSQTKEFGVACNNHCRLVPNDEDWICIMDGDCMFLTPDFGTVMQQYIDKYPETGLFTCLTNRVGTDSQMWPGMFEEKDILEHRKVAMELRDKKHLEVKELGKFISGYLMLFKKSTWLKVGGFVTKGVLAVDNHFSSAIYNRQMKIRLMESLYVLHYYRMAEGVHDKSHLLL